MLIPILGIFKLDFRCSQICFDRCLFENTCKPWWLDPGMDQLQLRRLKKRKLALKDIIARLESRLIPDQLA